MEERLIVKNFGPLKDVDIPLKDVMVFIGPQGSGKSTIAKLLAVCSQAPEQDFVPSSQEMKSFGLSYGSPDSIIYETKKYSLKMTKGASTMENNFPNYSSAFLNEHKSKVSDRLYLLRVARTDDTYNKLDIIPFKDNAIREYEYLSKFPDFAQKAYSPETKDDYHSQVLKGFLKDLRLELAEINPDINLVRNAVDFSLTTTVNSAFKVFSALNLVYEKMQEIFMPTQLIYVPAERILLPTMSNSVFGILSSNLKFPKSILQFGSQFEKSKIALGSYAVDFLNITHKVDDGVEKIITESGVSLDFNNAASGQQSIIPLMMVVDYANLRIDKSEYIFIIEEPELNLYPSAQKKLVDFLVRKCTKGNNKLIITTHSPYILTALNNHIEAAEAAKNEKVSSEEVEAIMPKESWLDFDRVGAWYVDGGTCRDIMDKEEKLIVGENIDDVSTDIMTEFDSLMHLKYKE